ncbi:MAG: hypothetical protein IJ737_00680 [Ruminococcus sp.]|nr:hypothetical protein [Ruminococcus sp.]
MKNKLTALLACCILAVSLTACGDSNDSSESKTETQAPATQAAETEGAQETPAETEAATTTTAATTTAPATTTTAATTLPELKYTWDQFPCGDRDTRAHIKGKMTFMGVDLSAGLTVQDLLDSGFKTDMDLSLELEPNKKPLGGIDMTFGDKQLDCYINVEAGNLTDSTITLNEATINDVTMILYPADKLDGKDYDKAEYTLPGGVYFGADMMDVYNQLGLPESSTVDDSDYAVLEDRHYQAKYLSYDDDDNGYYYNQADFEFDSSFKLYSVRVW